MKTRYVIALSLLIFASSVSVARAQFVFTVDSITDGEDLTPGDGVCRTVQNNCTLRAAIMEANATPNGATPDQILFTNVPAVGSYATILLDTDALPEITEAVIIDATTAPIEVIIDGSNITSASKIGLSLDTGSDGSRIRGLTIGNFEMQGIEIRTNDNKIESNHIGARSDGTPLGNGIGIFLLGENNTIGGNGKGNVIGGNESFGISLVGDNNKIRGNHIGTNAAGDNLGNWVGINVSGTSGNIIGGPTEDFGNVVAFSGSRGIYLIRSEHTILRNNYVGTDSTGNDLGNAMEGIYIYGGDENVGNNTVGGLSDHGNVVGFNDRGIYISYSDSNVVRSNYVGVTRDGLDVGNQVAGIYITHESDDNVVGYGASAVFIEQTPRANRVAYNGGPGIMVGPVFDPARNSIRGNRVFDNGGLGLDLGISNATANDAGDFDTGANALQNYPDVTQVGYNGGREIIAIEYSVSSDSTVVNYPLNIDVYIADDTVSAEGRNYIATDVYTTQDQNVIFEIDALSISWESTDVLVLTATDADGNTSEFSPASEEIGGPGNRAPVAERRDHLKLPAKKTNLPALSKPYPNPFNPQTSFTLTTPQPANYLITVHDVLGRQVAMLHDGWLSANQTTTFTFDASHLASGTYLLRVAGGEFIQTQKLVLTK